MTELERHLLNALEQLQQDYMQRLNEWENAFVELQKMFSLTQRDNAMLNGRVMQLSQQVQHLSERTERLSQLPYPPAEFLQTATPHCFSLPSPSFLQELFLPQKSFFLPAIFPKRRQKERRIVRIFGE